MKGSLTPSKALLDFLSTSLKIFAICFGVPLAADIGRASIERNDPMLLTLPTSAINSRQEGLNSEVMILND